MTTWNARALLGVKASSRMQKVQFLNKKLARDKIICMPELHGQVDSIRRDLRFLAKTHYVYRTSTGRSSAGGLITAVHKAMVKTRQDIKCQTVVEGRVARLSIKVGALDLTF